MSAATFIEGLRRGQRLRRSRTRRLAFCAVATGKFLPWVLVLFDALRRHHPDAARVLLYVPAYDEPRRKPRIEGATVLGVGDLVDAALEADLRRRYDMPELCFALKPRLLRHCLDRFGERALYMDSDLAVQAPLDQALIELEAAAVVLTPHLDTPIPRDGMLPSEMTILRAGSCNAGFVAVADSREARDFLAWWDSRVSHWGFVEPEAGYQGDQKWLDLAPTLFARVAMLRDPGSNAGVWNLHSRVIAKTEAGYTANGSPLAFFHFSGFDPETPAVLSKYQNRFRLSDQPALEALAADFAQRLLEARPRAAALAWDAAGPATHEPGARTASDGPMPDEAYRASYAVEPPPGIFATGEEVALNVRVTNTSGHTWPVGAGAASGGIGLSWHLREPDGTMVKWENDRYWLPADLAPGESVDVVVGVRAPNEPARYVIELDLVHEGHTWFSPKGCPTVAVPIRVGYFDTPA